MSILTQIEKQIQPQLDVLKKTYPKADEDLLKHYLASQYIKRIGGPVLSGAVGLFKEVMDGIGGKSVAGFSTDDLGADWAGITMSPQEAYGRGLFTHTEKGTTGMGQGLWKDVLGKVM